MKSSLFGVGVAAMAIVTSVMNTVGIAEAQLLQTQPNLNIPAFRRELDLYNQKVN